METQNQSLQLLKPIEAAKLLAISERTLWALTKNGTIPSVKLGRSVRYIIPDIERTLISLQNSE